MPRGWRGTFLAVAALCAAGGGVRALGGADFSFEVRPLLADRCFSCHGPDEKSRKAGLRLDTFAGATAAGARSGRRAIVPGDPAKSELWRRVTSSDRAEVMPPPASHLTLDDAEKDLLRRWIEGGAEYRPHWAFTPIRDTSVPTGAAGKAHPIDALVLARLRREGLDLAPEAPRERLIRRLSLDLTGLPPAAAEIDAFVADGSPDAYGRLVDRLLASPAYGERRANEWLDLARYADTYGYQNDVERDASAWRDWVIRAFNGNLPYDQFLTWQLAGDRLPSPTRDQILATAFNRLHRQTNEGGSIDEEFRTEYAADRVHTAGTAFLGLTMECARCHDHKFDPITQRDYYRMFAFFNSIDESGLYSHFTMATPSPSLLLYPPGAEERHGALRAEIARAEGALEAERRRARGRFAAWRGANAGSVPAPKPLASFPLDAADGKTTPEADGLFPAARLIDGPAPVPGKVGQALRFSGDNSLAFTNCLAAFDRDAPFSFGLWLRPAEAQPRAVIFHRSRAWTDAGSRGYEMVLEDMRPTFGLIHFWPGNALVVRAREPLPVGRWTHLAITYDGSSRASGVTLYRDGRPAATETVRDNLFKGTLYREAWKDLEADQVALALAGRFRDSGFKGGEIDEFMVFDHRLTAAEVAALAGVGAAPGEEAMFEWFAERVDPGCRERAASLRRLRGEENRLIDDVPEIMVMQELPERRAAHVLARGAYDAPGERVEPGTPEAIFPFPPDLPRDRLGLARWMTDPKNPLVSRVAVNRAWRTHFGRGLVATAEDFGSQGQLPSHPELLDWLAAQFIRGGWDVKALHRLIVTSATYRQSSEAPPGLLARDPENRLLARGPKHRLDAEQIRDAALAASGLLNRRIGGPSARPYQPEGLWEESGTGKTYAQDTGDLLYRRSLYTFWKRTAPPPSMLTFDATSREVCVARRETTATPLQALVLLNDPQFVEAARVLAETLLRDAGDSADPPLESAMRRTLGRAPSPREREILGRLHEEQLRAFSADPEAARRLIRVGARPPDPTIPPDRLAAATVLASALLNHDEFVMKR